MFNHCSAELTPGSRERTQALIQLSRLTASHTAEEPAKRAHRRPTELLQMSREPAKRHVEMGCFRRRIRTLDEEQRPLRVNLLITDDVGRARPSKPTSCCARCCCAAASISLLSPRRWASCGSGRTNSKGTSPSYSSARREVLRVDNRLHSGRGGRLLGEPRFGPADVSGVAGCVRRISRRR